MIKRWISPKVEEQEEPTGFDSFELQLGDVMRGERATLGKSLLDVQRELKIKATYIAAIENCDSSAFETQGFIAGYVRSYARYLGMDPEWAYETFCTESGFATAHGLSEEASTTKPARKEYSGDPLANPDASFVPRQESIFAGIEPGAVGSVAVLLALVGVIGFGGWSVLKEIQRVDFAPVEQTASAMEALPDPVSAELIASAGPDATETAPVPPTVEALDRLSRPPVLDVPVLVPRDGPIATLDPRSVGVLVQQPAPAAPARETLVAAATPEPVAPATPVVLGEEAPEVVLFAVRPAWVRVRAADGTVIKEKVLDACERFVLPRTEQPPILRSGNAGAVFFAVNGTVYGPAGDGANVVKNVSLGAEALAAAYHPVEAGSPESRLIASPAPDDPDFIPASVCAR